MPEIFEEDVILDHQFEIGKYRPIYLWGGPGTVRMNKVKFMDYPVDEAAHMAVHEDTAARVVVEDMNCNWLPAGGRSGGLGRFPQGRGGLSPSGVAGLCLYPEFQLRL
jgi:hypothetical protein